jgi:hypothetical protein
MPPPELKNRQITTAIPILAASIKIAPLKQKAEIIRAATPKLRFRAMALFVISAVMACCL